MYKPRDHSTPRGGKNQAKQEEILRFAVSISAISLSTLHRTSQNKDEGQAFMTLHHRKPMLEREIHKEKSF